MTTEEALVYARYCQASMWGRHIRAGLPRRGAPPRPPPQPPPRPPPQPPPRPPPQLPPQPTAPAPARAPCSGRRTWCASAK